MSVLRSDEVSLSGSISNDIFSRLMYSTYVIADISLPNPNVFYELGIRHAIRTRTILIKDKSITNNVFDISHMRHIEYEDTASGLKQLSEELKKAFDLYESSINGILDNQFLELASLLQYQYMSFANQEEEKRKRQQLMLNVMKPLLGNPKIMALILDSTIGSEERNREIGRILSSDPQIVISLLPALLELGVIK